MLITAESMGFLPWSPKSRLFICLVGAAQTSVSSSYSGATNACLSHLTLAQVFVGNFASKKLPANDPKAVHVNSLIIWKVGQDFRRHPLKKQERTPSQIA